MIFHCAVARLRVPNVFFRFPTSACDRGTSLQRDEAWDAGGTRDARDAGDARQCPAALDGAILEFSWGMATTPDPATSANHRNTSCILTTVVVYRLLSGKRGAYLCKSIAIQM